MKINIPCERVFSPSYETTSNIPKIVQNVLFPEMDMCAARLSISKEGRQAYENDTSMNDYESLLERKRELLRQENSPQIDHSFTLGNKLSEIRERDKENYSIEAKASALLEAYASIYDEITKGYMDGTRNNYIEDENTESGYRKMTTEEEINNLDEAYDKYVSFFETQMQLAPKIIEGYEKHLTKLSDVPKSEGLVKAQNFIDEMKKKDIPENIADRMMMAKKEFLKMYSQYGGGILDMKKLLENVYII